MIASRIRIRPGPTMKSDIRFSLQRKALSALASGLLAGCSLQPVPVEEMSQARGAVAQAVSLSAAIPPGELKRVQEKMALAQRWVDARDHGPARWLAEQAQVDAELALARAAGNDARRALAQREQARVAYVQTSQLAQGPQ